VRSHRSRLRTAVTATFAINGLLFGAFFARMPAMKAEAGLGAGELGVALLAGAAALIASQMLAGALCVRWGSRTVVAIGFCAAGLLISLPSLAEGTVAFAFAMVLFSFGAGTLDVSMNAQGALAEDRRDDRVFSSFHAAFSVGGLAGALLGGLAAGLEIGATVNLAVIGLVSTLAGLALLPAMLPPSADATPDGPVFARPSRALAGLAVIGLLTMMAEGAVADWSAILLVENRGAAPALAALGLAAFSVMMACGRLAADPLSARFGSAAVVRAGALTTAAGAALVVAPLAPGIAIAGYAVIGAGLAGAFPLTLRSASKVPGSPAATAIAAVSTLAYTGFLLGPALIGAVAELASLPVALAFLFPASAAVAALAPRLNVSAATPAAAGHRSSP
jgi:predicted MFS family arabinose efflux permease